jgi:hypothetical protein
VKIKNGKLKTSNRKRIFFAFSLFIFHISLFTFVNAQPPVEEPKDAEPPPLKLLSKSEKTQLGAATEIKDRTTLAIALMDARLKLAEDLGAKEAYADMFVELGGFHALMDNTLNFLNRNDDGSRRVLNNFKKFEISLRGFLSRIENIRRELPLKYEFYVRGLVKNVRDARTRAVEPLFDTTAVPVKDS